MEEVVAAVVARNMADFNSVIIITFFLKIFQGFEEYFPIQMNGPNLQKILEAFSTLIDLNNIINILQIYYYALMLNDTV